MYPSGRSKRRRKKKIAKPKNKKKQRKLLLSSIKSIDGHTMRWTIFAWPPFFFVASTACRNCWWSVGLVEGEQNLVAKTGEKEKKKQ